MDYPYANYLTKYRPLRRSWNSDPEQPDYDPHTIDLIKNGRIWYSSPANFNDPFDCTIRPLKPPQAGEFVGEFEGMDYLEYYLASRAKEEAERGNADGERLFTYKLTQRRNDKLEALAQRYAILSLSEIHDHGLMWSHYADNHRGIAITFDRSTSKRLSGLSCRPVRYLRHHPRISHEQYWNLRKDLKEEHADHDALTMSIFSKHEDWSYEKEWRDVLVSENSGGQLVEIDAKIKGIFFGYKTPEEDIEFVRSLCGDSVEFYLRMWRDEGTFALRGIPVDEWAKIRANLDERGNYSDFDMHEVMTRYADVQWLTDPAVAEQILKGTKVPGK